MEENNKSSGSIREQRPSNHNLILVGHSTFKAMVDQLICKCGALTHDGGKSSDTSTIALSTLRTRRFLKSKAIMIKKLPTLLWVAKEVM